MYADCYYRFEFYRKMCPLIEVSVSCDLTDNLVFRCYTRKYVDHTLLCWFGTFTFQLANSNIVIILLLIFEITGTKYWSTVMASRTRLLREDGPSDIITGCWVVNGNSHIYVWLHTFVMDAELVRKNACLGPEWNWWTGVSVTICQVFSTRTGNELQAWQTRASVLIESRSADWKMEKSFLALETVAYSQLKNSN